MFESIKGRFKPSEGSSLPFASTLDDLKVRITQVNENRKMGADLLFMITYMTSLAIANATRNEIFSFAANRKEYISSKYIANVDTYVTKWSFSYAESLTLVAERTHNDILKNLLSRY
jgi:flagellar protein FlaJ